jgi:hypothetical protein
MERKSGLSDMATFSGINQDIKGTDPKRQLMAAC